MPVKKIPVRAKFKMRLIAAENAGGSFDKRIIIRPQVNKSRHPLKHFWILTGFQKQSHQFSRRRSDENKRDSKKEFAGSGPERIICGGQDKAG